MPDDGTRPKGTKPPEPLAAPPLKVAVRLLEDHFGGESAFYLPWFQRAYAWDEEHAARLLSDVTQAMQDEKPHYFLGHILLAGPEGAERVALIDGHQRTLTLTIIFALLRDMAPTPAEGDRLAKLLSLASAPPGSIDAAPATIWRLKPQDPIAPFVERFVQASGATLHEVTDTDPAPSEIESNILDNRNRLRVLLEQNLATPDDWRRFVDFLLTRCYLVVEQNPDEDDAWAMLAVEETTGLPFHSNERLKVSLISAIDRQRQPEASLKWEKWQARLGQDDMQRMVGHVRAIRLGYRSTKPLEQDLIWLMSKDGGYETLFDNHIGPGVAHFLDLRERDVGPWRLRKVIARPIQKMQWLERDFWVPPAMKWLTDKGARDPETAEFFTQLERLSWILRISSNDPVQHERHFLRLCKQIRPTARLADIKGLAISAAMHDATLSNLLSRTFFEKKYSRLILRRISAELGSDSGDIDGVNATVEHVLPRRPAAGSPWRKAFPGKNAIKENTHRLGNLAVLSLAHNQEAGIEPYEVKRQLLRRSTYALARNAAVAADWTPDVIERRSRDLVNLLLKTWKLPEC